MTIKPIVNQKSSEKKENHGHGHGHSQHQENDRQQNIVAQGGRTNRNKTSVEVQNSQLRNDVYEDITRHRRSPHKILGRSKRNDHHHHHLKRDQREREKISATPHSYGTVPNCSSNSLVVSSSGTTSNKSPKHQHQHQHILSSSTLNVAGSNHQLQQNAVVQQCSGNQVEETYSGYNSGDEHLVPGDTLLTPDEWKTRDEQFVKAMSERGFIIKDIVEDGACLFRAISLQIYGDQEMHEVIRQQTMDYISQNREYFTHFVTEDINSYVKRKRSKDSHGNHIEIQAMSEIYNRPVELYCYKTTPINIFNSEQINNGYDPLRLSYQRGSHYNAILDPYNASVGVGLGLADYKPESQTREAIRLSEQLEIEKTMFEDKLKTTDWEATNEAIEEQIARESYLQWCRENMQKASSDSNKINQNKLSTTQNCTSSTVTSAEAQNTNNSNLNLNSNLNIKNNNNNCETITSCNDTISSKDMLLAGNSNMGNNSNNNIGNLNKNNSDYEKISDQSLKMSSIKKKDCSGNCSSKNKDSSGKSNDSGIRSECNSPYDSDDTDMSSTSSVDQYHLHNHHNNHSQRFTKSSKNQQRLSKKLKRHHGDVKRKRHTEETNENKNCQMKRSRNYVRHHLDNIQEECTQNEFKCDNNKLDKKHHDNGDFKRAIGSPQNVLVTLASTAGTEKIAAATTTATPTQDKDKVSELPCTSKQAEADDQPISRFYQSLLESSYTEDGMGQLSENEMLQKAIEMSRMDFIEEQKRKFAGKFYSTRNNDRRINNDTAADEDSDTLST